ncbi:MAG TPA: family 1 encapsulin nanocompartment shell protein [Candidatus Binatia bacterium]|nr:family 1 encapsulin nanocompartment shell protein [Candidatus Binatia bacterium]
MTENLAPSEFVAPDLLKKIEEAAVSAARDILSGRRIIDVEGPYGLGLTTLEVGNDDLCRQPGPEEASAVVSRALSLPMIYRRFSLSKRRIAAFQELGQPLNLKIAEDAAQAVAMREEDFIYNGQPDFHLHGLLTAEGRNVLRGGDWGSVDQVLDNVIAAVNTLDGKGYRGPYGLALAPALYNNLFRRYPGSDLLQIEHLKRLCTRGIVKAPIEGGVLVAKDVGSIVLGQDLQIAYLTSDAAHEDFAVSESLVLKIEAPDAICTIMPTAQAARTDAGRRRR